MTDQEILDEWNTQFEYEYDAFNYGGIKEVWTVLTKAPWKGDCEDYSLTLLYRLCGKNIFKMLFMLATFQASILFCNAYGGGHAVLWYKGKVVDNIQRKWTTIGDLKAKGYSFKSIWTIIHFIPLIQFLKLGVGTIIAKIRGK